MLYLKTVLMKCLLAMIHFMEYNKLIPNSSSVDRSLSEMEYFNLIYIIIWIGRFS